MDIQWVIIARACRLNDDRTLDIAGIAHRFRIFEDNNKVSMFLIMKAHFSPTEAGESKTITLQLEHDKNGIVKEFDIPYKIPDMNNLVNRKTYIMLNLNTIEFDNSGTYTFNVIVDKQYKNEESLDVEYAS